MLGARSTDARASGYATACRSPVDAGRSPRMVSRMRYPSDRASVRRCLPPGVESRSLTRTLRAAPVLPRGRGRRSLRDDAVKPRWVVATARGLRRVDLRPRVVPPFSPTGLVSEYLSPRAGCCPSWAQRARNPLQINTFRQLHRGEDAFRCAQVRARRDFLGVGPALARSTGNPVVLAPDATPKKAPPSPWKRCLVSAWPFH